MSANHPCVACHDPHCYVHCIYCGEPTGTSDAAESGLPHSPTCATETGLYPVRARDVECHGGCGCITGMVCGRCDTPLEVGDLYAQVHLPPVGGLIPTYLVACLGCALLEKADA